MARDLLDDLLEELNKSSSEDDEEDDIPLIQLGNNLTDGPQSLSDEDMQQVDESINILKTLTSSSAKKRMVKDGHCHFCQFDCERQTMHQHLSESERCRVLYFRKYHVNSIDAVMVVTYKCLFCEKTDFERLFHHIETYPECQRKYFAKFGVSSSNEVSVAITRLKRSTFPSRRPLFRNKEGLDRKRRKYEDGKQQTMESILNTHTMATAFGNVKLCIRCKCYVNDATEIDTDDPEKEHLRRLNRFWICRYCDQEDNLEEMTTPSLKMMPVESEDHVELTFVPDLGQNGETETNSQSAAVGGGVGEQSIKVILPCSVKSISYLDQQVSASVRGLSPFNIQRLLYRSGRLIDKEFFGHIYQNQMAKYRSAERNADLFSGKIDDLNIDMKVLSSVNPCSKEHEIRGSYEFRRRQFEDVKWRMDSLGRYCLKLMVAFPLINLQTVMTSLIQQGKVVTMSYSGDRANELHQSYTIHAGTNYSLFIIAKLSNIRLFGFQYFVAGHDSSSACVEECVTVTEDTYQGLVESNPDISTYVSSVDSKVNSFLKNIIKSPASPFESQIYFLQVTFNRKGEASLEGVIWPKKFQNINMSLIDDSFKFDVELEELVNLFKCCISTSSKKQSLKEQFSLCDQEAKNLEKLVKTYQLHLCEDSECEKCSDPPLPSLEWIITKCPDEMENIYNSKRLLGALKSNIMSLRREDLLTMSTVDWLEQLWDEMESEVEENVWTIEYDSELIQFKLNHSLNILIAKYSDCPLLAAYHYALSCVEKDQENKIIVRRSHLRDMFTEPFFPFFLKAAKSPISVIIITSYRDWKASSYSIPDYENALKNGLSNHTSVSLSEAICLTDSNKARIKSSTALEYVFTGPDAKPYFKKVREHNENCFVLAGEDVGGVFYEYQETIVSRYFRRMNAKELLLCELAAFYEYSGRESSDLKFQVYKDRLDKIDLSDVVSVSGNEKLPVLVLIENGDVLQMKKGPKILKHPEYPNDSFEFRHSQVLLFQQIERRDDMDNKQKVEDMFIHCDDNGVNVVEMNRKKFYKIVRKLKYVN